MTIAHRKRATLCGLSEDKASLLNALQDAGCMHLVPLRDVGPLEPTNPGLLRRTYSAYRHLNEAAYQLRPWPKGHAIELDAVIEAALKNKDRLHKARDRRDFLAERIAGLEPFGDFALPAAEALRGMKLWFYVLPARQRRALLKLDLPWQILGRDRLVLGIRLAQAEDADDRRAAARMTRDVDRIFALQGGYQRSRPAGSEGLPRLGARHCLRGSGCL